MARVCVLESGFDTDSRVLQIVVSVESLPLLPLQHEFPFVDPCDAARWGSTDPSICQTLDAVSNPGAHLWKIRGARGRLALSATGRHRPPPHDARPAHTHTHTDTARHQTAKRRILQGVALQAWPRVGQRPQRRCVFVYALIHRRASKDHIGNSEAPVLI